MSTLLDYIKRSQFDSIYDYPLNALDLLALTELSYLPFADLVTSSFGVEKGIRIDHLAKQFAQLYSDGFPPLSMITKNRLSLLTLMAESKRFKYFKAFAYADDYSLDQQKQFAAISFSIHRNLTVTSFRGTDDSLIGWKEDFHMTYLAEIPAQKAACHYLTLLMTTVNGDFYVTGHSKGGNLALYSSSFLSPDLQKRLINIFAYDAPGLHQSVIQSQGYLNILDKIKSIIPQNSIVGLMLQPPPNAQIVQSKTIGLLQHISFSWEIEDNDFKLASGLTDNSLQTDQTLKTWTDSLTDQELKDFFDLFFGIFIQAGIYRFSDLTVHTPHKIKQIVRNRRNLQAKEQEIINKLISLLIDTRYQVWKESLSQLFPNPHAKLEEWWQHFRKEHQK